MPRDLNKGVNYLFIYFGIHKILVNQKFQNSKEQKEIDDLNEKLTKLSKF